MGARLSLNMASKTLKIYREECNGEFYSGLAKWRKTDNI